MSAATDRSLILIDELGRSTSTAGDHSVQPSRFQGSLVCMPTGVPLRVWHGIAEPPLAILWYMLLLAGNHLL